MTQPAAIILFVVLACVVFLAFGMQRTTLLLSREANAPAGSTALLLPMWFPAVWLPRVGKWALVLYIGTTWSWPLALGVAVADFLLAVFLPIPHRMYVSLFRRRIDQLRSSNPEIAHALDELLRSSSLTKRTP